jgi:hypothetical protein
VKTTAMMMMMMMMMMMKKWYATKFDADVIAHVMWVMPVVVWVAAGHPE